MAQSIKMIGFVALDRMLGNLDNEIKGFKQTVERHYARDTNRIHSYFHDLRREMAEEIERRDLRGDALEIRKEKQKQFFKEESAKLASLKDKYQIRIMAEPRALLLARLPVTRCDLLVKRRKTERRLSVIYNLLSKRVDPLACEACGADTMRPSFCDTECHLLCEACLSKSGGRGMPDCPRCRGGNPPGTMEAVFERRKVRRINNESQ
jgi:hypothetical protein